MYAETKRRFGGIDVLYNNAGISTPDDAGILDTSVDAWQRVQDVNARGVFPCCKHGHPVSARARRLGVQRGFVRRIHRRRDGNGFTVARRLGIGDRDFATDLAGRSAVRSGDAAHRGA